MRTTPPRSHHDHLGFVVFGIDYHDHRRAAWFSPREQFVAKLASNMAGFRLFQPCVGNPAHLREWLPRGTRLESGRFIVPRIRRGLYEKLCQLEIQAERIRHRSSCRRSSIDAGERDLDEAGDTPTWDERDVEALFQRLKDSDQK
jgi:hypothetical protein